MAKILKFDGFKILKHEGTIVVGGGGSSSNPLLVQKIAGEDITSFKAVILSNGQAFIYNSSNIGEYNKVAGIAYTSALQGSLISILLSGILTVSFPVTNGAVYYATNTGALTTTPNTVGLHQEIGIGISSTEINIDIKQATVLI